MRRLEPLSGAPQAARLVGETRLGRVKVVAARLGGGAAGAARSDGRTRAAPTEARVRAAAVEANARRLIELIGPAALCAVVKADGYGHGAVTAAQAALAGGAAWLAVATVDEALEIAETVGREVPVLVLSEFAPQHAERACAACPPNVRFTVASIGGLTTLASAQAIRPKDSEDHAAPGPPRRMVHLKVDTGMHRMGVPPEGLHELARALRSQSRALRLEGVWTHLAVADSPADDFTAEQLRRFDRALAELRAEGARVRVAHAANSAGSLAHPDSRLDLVRAGIVLYGAPPSPETAGLMEMEPALELVSHVTALRSVASGEGVSYGRLWRAEETTRVATVPVGYADGVRRDSGKAGVEVLVRGRRCSVIGAVTMDQMMIALPSCVAEEVAVGDEVVLIGEQGGEKITATEIAGRLGTIAYEVLTAISSRVPRRVC